MMEHTTVTDETENLELELAVRAALNDVFDPEIPTLSVVDLGMVEAIQCTDDGNVSLRMMPTFMGCPALLLIENNLRKAISQVEGVASIDVEFVHSTPWTSERITEAGREKLREFGIAPPKCGLLAMQQFEAACPYCGSTNTQLDNLFGPTACRAIFHCNDCRQPFEAMKPV
jgi:ring-1,2-phenylacetyl-CoA epoxidase subunit PaaD